MCVIVTREKSWRITVRIYKKNRILFFLLTILYGCFIGSFAWGNRPAVLPAPVSLPVPADFQQGVLIKVLLLTAKHVTIDIDSYANIYTHKTGAYVGSVESRQINVDIVDDKLAVNDDVVGVSQIRLTSLDRVYGIQGKKYVGDILIIQKDAQLLVINEVDLETYVKGVLPSEMFVDWHIEALKAQAVVARTYAVFAAIERAYNEYHVQNNTFSQVYGGENSKVARTNEAVDATRGEVLEVDDKVFPAYFHSTCGGHTADSEYVWKGIDHVALQTVYCPFCWESPHYYWQNKINISELNRRLQEKKYIADDLVSFDVDKVSEAGRIMTFQARTVTGEEISIWANDLRVFVLPDIMKSALCDMRIEGERVMFEGYGFGHGVGMCQWGARKMAEAGYDYTVIVNFYYRRAQIKNIYNNNATA